MPAHAVSPVESITQALDRWRVGERAPTLSSELLDVLASVPDPRDRRGRRYRLAALLAIALLATAAGMRSYAGFASWAASVPAEVLAQLGIRVRRPSEKTFRTVRVARWIVDTGTDAYRSAFGKLVLHGEARAGLEFTAAERAAFDRVSRLAAEQRAMGEGSGPVGSYLVPFELDPTVIPTSGGSANALMAISRVVSTLTDTWHGVSSAGVTAEWLAEAAEASDASPTLDEPTVSNHKLSVWVPFSVELEGDAVSLISELGRLLQDGATQLLNQALAVGSGNGQPKGIVTALAGTGSQVNTAANDALVSGDVYNLQGSLPPRFQANAGWAANLLTLNALRQFDTANGALKFPSLQADPPTLLGRPAHELSNMDGTIDAGQDNNILLYGDFNNFVISQRVGSSVELIPQVFGPNRRPTGQRGMWLWARYGSDCVNSNAFRMLTA